MSYFKRLLENWLIAIPTLWIRAGYCLLEKSSKNFFLGFLATAAIIAAGWLIFIKIPLGVVLAIYVVITIIYAIVKSYREHEMIEYAYEEYHKLEQEAYRRYNQRNFQQEESDNREEEQNEQHSSNAGQNTGDYPLFAKCRTPEEAKVLYREFQKRNHPDNGGSEELLKIVNEQYARYKADHPA